MKPSSFFIAVLLSLLLMIPNTWGNDVLSLKTCIEAALKNHPNIRSAAGALGAAEGRLTQANSSYYPHVLATSGYSENHSLGALGDSVQKGYATTLSVNQLLYDFGRTGNAAEAARAGLQSSERDRDRVILNVILDVKQAYFALLQAEKLLIVARKTLEQSESHLKQAEAFFRSGSKPKFDVTRAEVDVNNSRLGLITATNNARLCAIALNNAMGTDPGAPVSVVDVFPEHGAVPSLVDVQSEAVKNRPEMLKTAADVAAAQAKVDAEQSSYYPSITANGAYTWASGTASMGVFQGDLGNSWNAGVSLNLPLFEGGVTRGKVAEARAGLLVAEAQRDALRQAILLDVNRAYADYESAVSRIEVMKVSLRKAQENLALAEGRYKAGVGPTIEVTDAQVAALKAETDHVQANYDYELAIARLEMAMGKVRYE